jgi:hypothetical protein
MEFIKMTPSYFAILKVLSEQSRRTPDLARTVNTLLQTVPGSPQVNRAGIYWRCARLRREELVASQANGALLWSLTIQGQNYLDCARSMIS